MINTIDTSDAIQSLKPNAEWVLRGDVLEWLDSEQTKPTALELSNEVIRLQAEFDAQAYARNREAEYPSVQECVHAILDDTLTALQAKRQVVKTKYPKG